MSPRIFLGHCGVKGRPHWEAAQEDRRAVEKEVGKLLHRAEKWRAYATSCDGGGWDGPVYELRDDQIDEAMEIIQSLAKLARPIG